MRSSSWPGFLAIFPQVVIWLLMVGLGLLVGLVVLVVVQLLLVLLPTAATSWGTFAQNVRWVPLIRAFATACGITCYLCQSLVWFNFLDVLSKNPRFCFRSS